MWFKSNIRAMFIIAVLFLGLGCTPEKKDGFRVLTAGIRHETNSFMPYLTTVEDFTLLRGSEVTKGSAWASFLEKEGVEVIPTLHAISGPSGIVPRETYEAFRDEILEAFRKAGPAERVYQDLPVRPSKTLIT